NPKYSTGVVAGFIFQEEDGIRDGNVTGVQTCALPILSSAFTRTKGGEAPPLIRPPEISPRQAEGRASLTGPKSPARASAAMTARSEERRVGKEGDDNWNDKM